MNGTAVRTVTKIEANPLLVKTNNQFTRKNVAGYCRVSTDEEDQINSYKAQIAYYSETIAKNPNWNFVGIYADEGISGTATTKRKDFLRLMRDCEKGKVDYILTKSISRFARNTVDSLIWTRKLRAMGIGVYFEEQALDSLKAENEMLIGLFSVIAQSESENISANVRWGIRQSMKSGTYMTNFSCYGYARGEGKNGVPVIVPEQAEVVRTIFNRFLDGDSVGQIKEYLESKHIPTYSGLNVWDRVMIRDMLQNEKYVGDLLLQKSYITDCITKKSKKNRGELPKYLISNNHEPIIDRDTFNLVQVEMARRSSKSKKSDLAITERGKYSGKFALTDVLICGCCGSYFRCTVTELKDIRSVIPKGNNRKEKHAFVHKNIIFAYESGEIDDIYDYKNEEEYEKLSEAQKKVYQYYEWNDEMGWYKYFLEILDHADWQVYEWDWVNEGMRDGVRIVCVTM